jgi:hypothetical protein
LLQFGEGGANFNGLCLCRHREINYRERAVSSAGFPKYCERSTMKLLA